MYQFPALGNTVVESYKMEGYSMQGKVEICGVNTARLTLLTAQQMDELLRRAKSGDTAAL